MQTKKSSHLGPEYLRRKQGSFYINIRNPIPQEVYRIPKVRKILAPNPEKLPNRLLVYILLGLRYIGSLTLIQPCRHSTWAHMCAISRHGTSGSHTTQEQRSQSKHPKGISNYWKPQGLGFRVCSSPFLHGNSRQ